jgi:hypothetical protein
MEHEKSYQYDFGFVLNYVEIRRIYTDSLESRVSHKITKKLRKYNHSNTNNDFRLMYVKYYLDGYLHKLDFDEIVKDGVFSKFDYKLCLSFFLEVYDDNQYLMQKFESKNCDYFKNNTNHDKYTKWLTENFRKSYNQINNIVTQKYENTISLKMNI